MYNLQATTSSFLIIVSLRHVEDWLDVSRNVCKIMEFVLNIIS